MNGAERTLLGFTFIIAILSIACVSSSSATALSATPESAKSDASEIIVAGVVRGGWPPFIENSSALDGLSGDILKQALRDEHFRFAIKTFNNHEALNNAVCRGEIDLILESFHTAGQDNCLIYSQPYYRSTATLFVRSNLSPASLKAGARPITFAMERGTVIERELRLLYPRAGFVLTQSQQESIDALQTGRADIAAVPGPVADSILRDRPNVRPLATQDGFAAPRFELRFAVARSKPALQMQIDAGLRAISPDVQTQILSKWIPASYGEDSPDSAPALNDAEKAYLLSLPAIRTSLILRFAPFSFLNEAGRLTGVLPEYLEYLERRLGIRFEQRSQQSPGREGEALRTGATDLIVYVLPVGAEMKLHDATQPVETFPVIVAGRRDAAPLNGIQQLGRSRVAVVERSNNLEMLRARAPHAQPVLAPSLEQALRLVQNGQADVAIGNLAAIDYLLQRGFDNQIKVLGTTGYQQGIGFQLRPGLEPLIPLLNRTIAAMPESQRIAINNRHLSTSYDLGMRWSDVAKRAGPFALLFAVGTGILIVSHARLKKEIRRRKAFEQMLRTQLRFRETLLDIIPIPVSVRDRRGAFIEINAAGIDAMDVAKETLIGKTLETYVTESPMPDSLAAAIQRLTEDDQQFDGVHLEYVNAAGVRKQGLYWRRSFHDERGNLEGTVGAIVDLTALLNAQEQTRVTQALLADVTGSLPAAVFQMKRAPDGTVSFPFVGGDAGLFPEITRDASAAADSDAAWTLLPVDRALLEAKLDASAASLDRISLDFRVTRAASNRWLHVNAMPRRDGNGATLWSGYWSDTTLEHARSLELEEARDEAQRLSAAKDQFLAVMSHEIRTPMSGVIGLVEVLEKSRLSSEQGVMVRLIHDTGGSLLKLLDNILDFSKIEAAKLVLETAEFDIREECDLVLGILSGRAQAKHLALRCRIGRRVSTALIADRMRLRQVFFNLLSNAIKFTAQGSVSVEVDIDADADAAPGDDRRQALLIRVVDTGIGIDALAIETLFAPFAQASSSTARQFGGSGLGLLISRRLVELMQGTLVLSSKPGAGTTVEIRVALPMAEHAVAPMPDAHGHAVVLLEDAPLAADLLDRLDALGIAAERLSVDLPSAVLQNALDEATLIFVDAASRRRSAVQVIDAIDVTDQPWPAGYDVSATGVSLSVNPLTTRALRAVCEQGHFGLGVTPDHEQQAAASTTARASREDALRQGALILVAEDNPVNRHLIKSQLRLLGCVCDLVDDGVQALIAYDACRYALLLTDCQMPRLDGSGLATHIRSRERAEHAPAMPIVGVTAGIDAAEMALCTRAGMNECIHKPASLELLRATLQKWAPACLSVVATAEPDGARSESNPGDFDILPALDWTADDHAEGRGVLDESLLEAVIKTLRADVAVLAELLHEPDAEPLHRWFHRMAGAVAVLHYAPLLEALSEFRTFLVEGDRDAVRQAGQHLLHRLNHFTDQLEATEN